jgi:hypothetical protein
VKPKKSGSKKTVQKHASKKPAKKNEPEDDGDAFDDDDPEDW